MDTIWIVVGVIVGILGLGLFFFLILRQYHLSTSHQTKLLNFMER